MRRLLSFLLLALFSLVGSPANAQERRPPVPSDVSLARFDSAALPAAPEEFLSRTVGSVRWDYPAAAQALVDELMSTHRDAWPRIERELGVDVDDSLVIRVGRDPEEMAALAPRAAPPPPYAVGVAYPATGLVLLTLAAPETWERPAIPQVLTHELSHVALHRAVGGRPVPRWLSEGLAIHQARERSFERMQTLWEATVRGTLIPLDELSRSFPSQPHRVSVAYAQSADFVEWLRRRGGDDRRFAELVSRIGRDQPFESAVSLTWSAGIGQLEHEWRTGLGERFGTLPLLLGTGTVWVLIGVLVVIAWARRRRENRRTLGRWQSEEDAEDRARAAAIASASISAFAARGGESRTLVGGGPPPPAPTSGDADDGGRDDLDDGDDDASPRMSALGPRQGRDPHVPTIEWEGRSHTLH